LYNKCLTVVKKTALSREVQKDNRAEGRKMTGKIGLTRLAGKISDAILCKTSSTLNDGRPPAIFGSAALSKNWRKLDE
jgi:hypothetical protein